MDSTLHEDGDSLGTGFTAQLRNKNPAKRNLRSVCCSAVLGEVGTLSSDCRGSCTERILFLNSKHDSSTASSLQTRTKSDETQCNWRRLHDGFHAQTTANLAGTSVYCPMISRRRSPVKVSASHSSSATRSKQSWRCLGL